MSFIYFFKYETIETHARTFLTLNISSIGTVSCKQNVKVNVGKYLLVFTLLQWTPQLWIYANLCKVVWEPLEMGLFTLGKLDLGYFSTGILYSSHKVPKYTAHCTLSTYLVECKRIKRLKRLSAYKAVIRILFVTLFRVCQEITKHPVQRYL